MKILFVLLSVYLTLFAGVNSHAVLTNPVSWNTNPSTASPCGNGKPATAPVACFEKNKPAILQWKVVAGDGTGPLTISIDPNGGTAFTVDVTQTAPTVNPNAVTSFNIPVTMPDITCDKCTLQAFSSSKWYSCSTIKIAETCDTQTTERQAVLAENLQFCNQWFNEKVVSIPIGQTPQTIDASVAATFASYLANPAIFNNNDTSCRNAYAPFLCAYNFPLDPGSEGTDPIYLITQDQCQNVNSICQVTQVHQTLYECNYPAPNSASIALPSILAIVFVAISALFF